MEEAKRTHEGGPGTDRPIIHRVCEACNNMFATHPAEKSLRCPNCTKEHKE